MISNELSYLVPIGAADLSHGLYKPQDQKNRSSLLTREDKVIFFSVKEYATIISLYILLLRCV